MSGNHPHNGAAVVDKPAKHARRAFAMRLQALALSRPAITPGGTTAATSSPVTSKRVRQPGLTGGAMAKAVRVGGVGGVGGAGRAASAVPAAGKGGTARVAGSAPAGVSLL